MALRLLWWCGSCGGVEAVVMVWKLCSESKKDGRIMVMMKMKT